MNNSMPDSSTILRETWNNGTTLLAYPNLTSPAVYFTGYMQPGSIADPGEMHGLASFTTDMLMTGTKHLNFQQLHDKIESIGASLSLSTGHISTAFLVSVSEKTLRPSGVYWWRSSRSQHSRRNSSNVSAIRF